MLPVSYHQPLPADVHEFLAHYSPGTFYDKAIQEFGARVGLDASDLALRQFLIRLRNAKRQPALHHFSRSSFVHFMGTSFSQ